MHNMSLCEALETKRKWKGVENARKAFAHKQHKFRDKDNNVINESQFPEANADYFNELPTDM